MTAALRRYALLVLAYGLAVAIAAIGSAVLMFDRNGTTDPILPFVPFMGFAAIVIGLYLALPAIIAVMVAEHWRLRQPWYDMAVATVGGVVLSAVLKFVWWLPLAGAVLGLASGFAFWSVAGRSAGALKESADPKAQRLLMALLALSALAILVALLLAAT